MTDTLGQEQQPLDPKIRKALKAAKADRKRLAELETQLAAKDRQIAFAQAGVPSDAKGAALAKVYDGDLDPTKIRATYEELFGELGHEDDGTAGAQRIADAGKGGGTTGAPGTVEFADALRAARGDNAKVLALIASAPPGAGIKLPDIQ